MKVIKSSLLGIPGEVRESIIDNARKLNYVVDFIIRGSNAPADNYLYYVVAHKSHSGLYKQDGYAYWLYNHSLRQLGCGHYGVSEGVALKAVVNKVYLVETF